MALANNLTAILNLLALLCSIPITASGIWLASKPDNECVNLLRWPVVVLGVLILVVSACGFIGAYQYKETLLAVYLCCMAILIGLLLVVLIFAFVVTRPDGSYQVPGRGYKEYRLEGFSNWLRENVVDSKNWGKIRACLADTNVCPKLSQQFITADQFFSSSSITPLQDMMISSDHRPVLACLEDKVVKKKRQFRFDKRWVGQEDFMESVERGWRNTRMYGSNDFVTKITSCRHEIATWRKNCQPYGQEKIDDLQRVLENVQMDNNSFHEDILAAS